MTKTNTITWKTQYLSWETLKGKKTHQNFLCIRCIRYNPKTCILLLLVLSLSLSLMRYTSEWVCVQTRSKAPLFILFLSTNFYPNQIVPIKLYESASPRKSQNRILLYSLGFYWPDLQRRLYLMTLWWPNTITSQRRNKTSPNKLQ